MPARDRPPPDDLEFALRLHPEGPLRQALIFADLSGELWAMDRYIGRAMSRRKFAIRDYNEALAKRDRDLMAIADHVSEAREAVAQDRAPVPPRPVAPARARGEVKAAAGCEEFGKREAAPPVRAILQNKATAAKAPAILQNKATAAKAPDILQNKATAPPVRTILHNKATDAHVRAPAGGAKPGVSPARMPRQDAARRIRAFLGLGTGPPRHGVARMERGLVRAQSGDTGCARTAASPGLRVARATLHPGYGLLHGNSVARIAVTSPAAMGRNS